MAGRIGGHRRRRMAPLIATHASVPEEIRMRHPPAGASPVVLIFNQPRPAASSRERISEAGGLCATLVTCARVFRRAAMPRTQLGPYGWLGLWSLGIALALFPGPVFSSVPPAAEHGRQVAASDTVLFALTVQAIAERTEGDIRVDPRPLRPDPGIGVFVRAEHFADAEPAAVRERERVLSRLGIAQFRKSSIDMCGSGPGGVMPVIEPGDTATRRAWLSRPRLPTCVLVSLPREGGAYFPPAEIDRREAHPGAGIRTVRVVTIGSGDAIDVFDVVARCTGEGRWQILEVARLSALRS